MSGPDATNQAMAALPALPRDADGPVFAEPWQAQAFAMTLKLFEGGLFTWSEWAAALAHEIKHAQAHGDPDTGDTYYQHWLAALERIIAEKALFSREEMAARKDAWNRAARATPHGEPIVLGRDTVHGQGN